MMFFSPQYAAGVFLGIVLPILIFSCFWELIRRPRIRCFAYYLLRAAATVLIFFFLMTYVNNSWHEVPSERDVIFLRDVSASMTGSAESDSAMFDAVENTLCNAFPPWLRVRRFSFASDTKERSPDAIPAMPSPDPGATALGEALISINEQHPGSSVILLSDGASNTGRDPLLATSFLRTGGTRIYPVILRQFDRAAYFDLALSDARHVLNPSQKELRFSAAVWRTTAADAPQRGRIFDVELSLDRALLLRKSLESDAHLATFHASAPELPEPGWHEFRVDAIAKESELFRFNNFGEGVFYVPDNEGVLLLYDRTNPDLLHLRPIFREKFPAFTEMSLREFIAQPLLAVQTQLEQTRVLLVDQLAPNDLPQPVQRLIAERIKQKKNSLLLLAPGFLPLWLNAPLFRELLPIKNIAGSNDPKNEFHIKSPSPEKESRAVALSVRNFLHLIPSEGAEVVLNATAADSPVTDENSFPVALVRDGVGVVGFSGIWRWKLSTDRRAAAEYPPFWESALADLAPVDQKGLILTVRPHRDDPDGKRFVFTLKNNTSSPHAELPKLFRLSHDGTPSELTTFHPGRLPNEFEAVLEIQEPGIHWFDAAMMTSDASLRSKRVPVHIQRTRAELRYLPQPDSVLFPLAALTGGLPLREPDWSRAADLVPSAGRPLLVRRATHDPAHYWRLAALAFCAILFLSLEWLLRKLETAKS